VRHPEDALSALLLDCNQGGALSFKFGGDPGGERCGGCGSLGVVEGWRMDVEERHEGWERSKKGIDDLGKASADLYSIL